MSKYRISYLWDKSDTLIKTRWVFAPSAWGAVERVKEITGAEIAFIDPPQS